MTNETIPESPFPLLLEVLSWSLSQLFLMPSGEQSITSVSPTVAYFFSRRGLSAFEESLLPVSALAYDLLLLSLPGKLNNLKMLDFLLVQRLSYMMGVLVG